MSVKDTMAVGVRWPLRVHLLQARVRREAFRSTPFCVSASAYGDPEFGADRGTERFRVWR
jgi:hypothetical protein